MHATITIRCKKFARCLLPPLSRARFFYLFNLNDPHFVSSFSARLYPSRKHCFLSLSYYFLFFFFIAKEVTISSFRASANVNHKCTSNNAAANAESENRPRLALSYALAFQNYGSDRVPLNYYTLVSKPLLRKR